MDQRKKIVLTREPEDNIVLARLFKKRRHKTLSLPAIRTKVLPLSKAGKQILHTLEKYDWIIFTSKKAASFFVLQLREGQLRFPRTPRLAAVGPETKAVLLRYRKSGILTPMSFTSSNVPSVLGSVRGKRILLPQSSIALPDLENTLKRKGAHVATLPLYTTTQERISGSAFKTLVRNTGAITFASPSAVQSTISQVPKTMKKSLLAVPALTLGPTTKHAAKKAGFTIVYAAKTISLDSLVALVDRLP